jgi:uracil phosphoribosyltransferase
VQVHVADHPLVTHKLTWLRDRDTDSPTFRRLVDELVTLLAYEATRGIRVEPVLVETPLAPASGVRLSPPRPIVVPILRAGLGMLDGMTRLLPTAEVGFLGMLRDEETLQPRTYANRLPDELAGRQCFVLDPMLATGGTLTAAVHYLRERGAGAVTAVCLLAAPEGLQALSDRFDEAPDGRTVPLTVVVAGLDSHLDDRGFIVPGLGDAGDRLYGAV